MGQPWQRVHGQERLCARKSHYSETRRYADTQGPDHVNTGIGLAKLGRVLLREKRYREAANQSLAAYTIFTKQKEPPESFLEPVCDDLATDFEALKDPQNAAKYRREAARIGANSSD